MNEEPRLVGRRTIWDLFKQRPVHLLFGTVFTLIPFLVGGIFILVLSLTGSDVPNVDYELINKNGSSTQATITSIETQENITIDNDHPTIIGYTYNNSSDQELEDKYKILDPRRVSKLNVGDQINIKYLDNKTIISGVKPFAFPTAILFGALIPFLVIGLILLQLLYWRVSDQIGLYKTGRVADGEIISMTPTSGLPISGIGQKVVIHYQYNTTSGQKILGESATTDYTVLTSKKQGSNIKIFVSRDNETNSCVISKLDEVRNNWKIQ